MVSVVSRLRPTRTVAVRLPESLDTLKRLCQQETLASDYKLAKSIESKIPVYDLADISPSDAATVSSLQDEWYQALSTNGPGVLVLKNFVRDLQTISQSNTVFDQIIQAEKSSTKGDHFAAAGSNSRVWNSFQKHAEADPAGFVRYYSNPWLARVSEAWLGPSYQVTAQLNVVRPGGQPQSAHRDYHLGFQTAEACALFPRGIHLASPNLTLQGGVAHSEVPLASGPTRLLPYSHALEEGYAAWRMPEFTAYFNDSWVSLPMSAGDAVFFNPALFHAAGANETTSVHRSVNLLQVSSAFGRPMETVDTLRIVRSCWDALKEFARQEVGEGVGKEGTIACINALAEGYPFPTNLDRRPPGPDGMAPISEIDTLWQGLEANWSTDEVMKALEQIKADSLA
ncbi:hypothetical protein BX600DRAFT_407900 [Xylariales sp. PMI_506]|nr:hypothetical protein BX600DRAFT_407900 [Xylariales sp. PMI_506]